ncbi:hypothetical protein C8Q79DRAFT_920383 [Trametes meyenii]|nr:hypothetical protein C8Q79DRAFT_920383 [Trametes meyenii]
MTVREIVAASQVLIRSLEPQAQAYGDTRSVSHSAVACATLITWDVLITFSEEVDFIWRRKWTATTYMYIMARYIPWMVLLALLPVSVNGSTGLKFTSGQCDAWQFVQGILMQVTITTVDVILITRVYALYRRSLILLQILVGLFAAEFAFLCYVLVSSNPRIVHEDECFVTSSPTFFKYYWIVSLLFETLLFALTIYKFVKAVHHGWGKSSVMQRFVTDGTWAYALIFLVMLVNMLLYEYAHSAFAGICYTWLVVVLSFAGSRLILNPRRAFVSSQEPTANDESSHIEFTRLSTVRPLGSPIRIPAHVYTSDAHERGRGHGVFVTIERVSDSESFSFASVVSNFLFYPPIGVSRGSH